MIEIIDTYSRINVLTRKKTLGSELDMVKTFIDYKKNKFKESDNKKLAIFVEPRINTTYPDIIFAEYNPSSYDDWSPNRKELTITDLKVLNCIFYSKKVKSEYLLSFLNINSKSLLQSIEKLLDAKLIIRKSGYWMIISSTFFGLHKIETVEAKISKINDALHQAVINKTFSNESWILTKRINKPSESFIEQINITGVGLYTFDNQRFRKISKAEKNKNNINYNTLYINEWIGRALYKEEQ